jgi:hypothetical protein
MQKRKSAEEGWEAADKEITQGLEGKNERRTGSSRGRRVCWKSMMTIRPLSRTREHHVFE